MRSRISSKFRKWGLVGLVFMLCSSLVAVNVSAASTGDENHKDTRDYCMIVNDVTVGLQELEGRSESEKEDPVCRFDCSAFCEPFQFASDTLPGTFYPGRTEDPGGSLPGKYPVCNL